MFPLYLMILHSGHEKSTVSCEPVSFPGDQLFTQRWFTRLDLMEQSVVSQESGVCFNAEIHLST